MRIVTWGINYSPELIGIALCNVALCEYLAKAGHDVTALTAFAYYPTWKKDPKDRGKFFETERLNGVRVTRCWHFVPRRVTTFSRILHELSFVLVSFLRLLCLPPPDLLLVVSPPFLLGPAARVAAWILGNRYVLHIQDLQPDAAINLQMVRSGWLVGLLRWLEQVAYKGAWRVSTISYGLMDALQKRGVAKKKLVYFPNGASRNFNNGTRHFRRVNQIDPGDFLVVYSGNLGVKQGLEHLVEVARLVENKAIQFVICGDGVEKERLWKLADGLPNVRLKSLLKRGEYERMIADAELQAIPLTQNVGNAFFPSKLLSSCAAGKPVLAMCASESELAHVVESNRCGIVVPHDDPKAAARLLDDLVRDRPALEKMSAAAKRFGERFLWDRLLEEYAKNIGTAWEERVDEAEPKLSPTENVIMAHRRTAFTAPSSVEK
jgi:colanic acid biosynthesis glycosyl transferase WcaI